MFTTIVVARGGGGQISELENLLGEMVDPRKDADGDKNRSTAESAAQEEKKLAAGQQVILNYLKRKKKKRKSLEEESDDDSSTMRVKRSRRGNENGLKEIGEDVRASDASRF